MVFAVEAGGSATRVAVGVAGATVVHRRRFGPVNQASVPAQVVRENWIESLSWVAGLVGPECPGWIATASLADTDPAPTLQVIREGARRAGIAGPLVVSNDVVPLLLSPPLSGAGFALIGGTGSTCLAGSRDGRAVRIGGHEYLLSDEGSGYQIGLAGLRAALRATEGTGPPTALSSRCPDLAGYARYLVASARAKTEVAAFATAVFGCWADGDSVAGSILRTAAADLLSLVSAASAKLGCPVAAVLMCGSLFTSTVMADLVGGQLRGRWPGCAVRVVPDAIEHCLTLAARAPDWPETPGPPLAVHRIA